MVQLADFWKAPGVSGLAGLGFFSDKEVDIFGGYINHPAVVAHPFFYLKKCFLRYSLHKPRLSCCQITKFKIYYSLDQSSYCKQIFLKRNNNLRRPLFILVGILFAERWMSVL